MDGDRLDDFETVYKSTLMHLETLRSIRASSKTAIQAGITENMINDARSEHLSGTPTQNNIEESITANQIHRVTENGMVFETQGTADNQIHGEAYYKDKENAGILSQTVTRSSSQSTENLKKQAREWACEQFIGVFEDHSQEVGKIGTHNHDMSKILRNVTKFLQEKVEEVQVKHKKAAELEEALSAEKSLVGAILQKQRNLQELLGKVSDTAESGIFMCGQCEFVAEKVKEPRIDAKKDLNPINCQFIIKGQMQTCHSANNLQSSKDSTTSSVHCLLQKEDGKKGSFIISPGQRINNLTSNICSRKLNGTHPILFENGCAVTGSKVANENDRVDPEIGGDVTTLLDPLLKRKRLDDGHDKEGGSSKAPKISIQEPNMQCSIGSKACYSMKSSEAYYIKHSRHHNIVEPDSVCDHEKNEDKEHSVVQAAAFTLLLEEEFEDEPK